MMTNWLEIKLNASSLAFHLNKLIDTLAAGTPEV